MLPEGALDHAPGPMNRGVEIDSDVADLPAGGDRGPGDERHRGPDVAPVPAARAAPDRGGGRRCLSRGACSAAAPASIDPRSGTRRRDATSRSRTAGSPPSARAGGGAEVIDVRRPGARAGPGRPAHPPARARLRAQGDRRDRDARRRGRRATRPCRADGRTPIRSPTTPAIVAEIRERAAAAGLVRRVPRRAPSRRACEGESLAEIGEMVDGRRADVQRRRQLRADGAHPAQRAHVREGVPGGGRDRRPLRGRVARRGRPDARGRALLGARASPGRPAEAEEIVVARDLAMARMTGGRLHVCHVSSARAVELDPPREGGRASASRPR